MAAKKEVIDKLLELGVKESKTALNKKTLEELVEMLRQKEAEKTQLEESRLLDTEVTEDSSEENEPVSRELEDFKVLLTREHQLRISTEFIYHVRNEGVVVEVENTGYGDAYVDSKPTKVGDFSNRLMTGQKKVFKDAKVIYMIAASQPVMKITEMK